MEIRCSECQHVGPAANVTQSEDGVLFICANCGHGNAVQVGGPSPGPAASSTAEVTATKSNQPPKAARRPDWMDDELRARLVPEPGEGLRCPKCLHLLAASETICARCGLDTVRARAFPPGEAPWETAPPGLEAEYEQAELLWSSALESPSTESLEKFVSFAREEGLTELGVRRLREWLVEHPEDEQAIRWLEEIAATFQARIMVARAQAEVSAEEFSESTEKFKRVLLIITASYFTVILIIAMVYFLG